MGLGCYFKLLVDVVLDSIQAQTQTQRDACDVNVPNGGLDLVGFLFELQIPSVYYDCLANSMQSPAQLKLRQLLCS